MAKQKYVRVAVNLTIGNRKSAVVNPVEVDDDANRFDGELIELLLNVKDAVKALPSSDGNYSEADFVDALCETFELTRKSDVEAE